jgi:hypothetical protein
VVEFDSAGNVLKTIYPTIGGAYVQSVAVDKCDHVWIGESSVPGLESFDETGKHLVTINNGWGNGPGQFSNLQGVSVPK